MQKALIDEEWSEFHEAYHLGTDEEELKELCDLVYVCYQYAVNCGWDLDEAMDRVHKSNMSKLGRDGKPIYREDGKVLKGPMYLLNDHQKNNFQKQLERSVHQSMTELYFSDWTCSVLD